MRLLPEPVPTIILPKYSTEDVFGLFLRFLEAQGFTLTATLCIKELAYRKLKSTDANRISKVGLACRQRCMSCARCLLLGA